MEDEIQQMEEGYGVETDEWMMEETRKEFISFREDKGAIIVILTGRPTKQRSKFGKDQFWFPCYELVGDNTSNYRLEERILSTSSHQLRKKITAFYHKHPDGAFKGEHPLSIYWEGSGMARYYSLQLCDDELQEIVLDLRAKL